MALEARDISFSYQVGGRRILDNFSARFERDERVGLIAPSGAGKTTLMKILAGYESADAGQVLLGGRALDSYRGYCPVQMIWQHPEQAIDPRMRMIDVLREAGPLDERVIEGVGIEAAWLNRWPGELSGGELQRFCIARALQPPTEFLIADEISTMLDLITQSQLWHFLLGEVRRRHIGLIAVSHQAGLLEHVCTRQITLDESRRSRPRSSFQ